MKKLIFPLVVLIALILVATFVYQSVSGPPKLLQMPEETAIPAPVAALPTIDADFDWGALDEDELNELLEEINGSANQPLHREEFSVVLAEGESVITAGFEREPGVFEFSHLSAKTITLDGEDVIEISAKRFGISVDGSEDVLSAPRIMTRPGVTATIQSGSMNPSGEMVDGFDLEVVAEPVNGGISLMGQVITH